MSAVKAGPTRPEPVGSRFSAGGWRYSKQMQPPSFVQATANPASDLTAPSDGHFHLTFGGQDWRLVIDKALVPFVREILSLDFAPTNPDCKPPAETMRIRLAGPDERALWQARHASQAGTNALAIVQFSDDTHSLGRLSSVSCELEGPSGLEWIWLEAPERLLTLGGAILLNAWLRRWHANWIPVHAAAIGCDGRYVLVPGAGGAGKSTLSAAALAAGWEVMADDFAWLLTRKNSVTVESPYATLRLTSDARAQIQVHWPEWRPAARCDQRGDGKWVSAEACTHRTGVLCGILRLQPDTHSGVVQALPSNRALLPEFRTAHYLLHQSGANANGYLGALCNALHGMPAGTLPRGPNLAENLANIEQWLNQI